MWALLAGAYTLAVLRWWFVCDDAYIAFRYGQNLAEGAGLRFNPSEPIPVEGYTQFAWVLHLGLLERLGLDPTLFAPLTTALAGALLLWLVGRFATRSLGLSPTSVGLGLAFLIGLPIFGVWASGGLETMVFALLAFAVYQALFADLDRPSGWWAGAFAAALCLTRADGPWWVAATVVPAFVTGWLTGRPALRRGAVLCAALGMLAVAGHTAFRLGYHQDFLPNTVRAKVGISAFSLERGARYLTVLLLTLPALPLLTLLGTGRAWITRDPRLIASSILIFATYLYMILVGGDFMAYGRFCLPALPHLALLLAAILQPSRKSGPNAFGAALFAACLISSLLPWVDRHVVPNAQRARFHFRYNSDEFASETSQWRGMSTRAASWALLGKALALYTQPTDSLVRGSVGAVGYYSRRTIYDRFALTDRDAVRVEPEPGARRSPGHDRMVPHGWFRRYEPTYSRALLRPRNPSDPLTHTRTQTLVFVPTRPSDGFPPGHMLVLTIFPKRPAPSGDAHPANVSGDPKDPAGS